MAPKSGIWKMEDGRWKMEGRFMKYDLRFMNKGMKREFSISNFSGFARSRKAGQSGTINVSNYNEANE